jgi:nitrilase
MIVDPWGEVLAVQAEGEGVVLAQIDAARQADVRARPTSRPPKCGGRS